MTYERPFGHPENIEQRLLDWRRRLATDKRYPWLGTGFLDDLVCAAKLLGADVSEFEEEDAVQLAMDILPNEPAQQGMEYDL